MERKEPASTRDVEPRIGRDEHASERRDVVAVQLADHPHHLVPAELLELLHTALGPAKQLKLAFEYLSVTLGEWPGIGVPRALRGTLQEKLAQLPVQRIAVIEFRHSERDGKKRDYLDHV